MFNNAGIAWGGDTELLTLDQWNTIIDINIRGVVHGVAAAYPVMLRQGHGHIVNTASMAGLTAAGQITSYVMTKHAVVGLSLALRSEAVSRGVGVADVAVPGPCRLSAVRAAAPPSTSVQTTSAPTTTNARHNAAPMPDPAPVTIACLPVKVPETLKLTAPQAS